MHNTRDLLTSLAALTCGAANAQVSRAARVVVAKKQPLRPDHSAQCRGHAQKLGAIFGAYEHVHGANSSAQSYAQQGDLVEDFKRGLLDYAWVGNMPAIELAEENIVGVFGHAQKSTRFHRFIRQNRRRKSKCCAR